MLLHIVCQVTAFLSSCQHPEGGYGGGPGQLAHLAPTYAAVSALLTLGGQEALSSINRCVER
jgi:protein farnesyltransferase subunit beta